MQDLQRIPPIVCHPSQRDMVRAAIHAQQEAGTLPAEVDVQWRTLRNGTLVAQVVIPARPQPRHQNSAASEIGKALAFVAALGGLGIAFVVIAFFALTHSGVDWAQVGGVVALGLIAALVLANRSNHKGACPGVAVHCSGCRH